MAHGPDPDASAVQAVLAGDRNAFRSLVDRHAPAVFALVRSFVRDGTRGEDLAQEAFVRAYRRLQQFDPRRGAFRTWLLAIARNRCRDELRKRSVASVPLTEMSAAPIEPADDAGARAALAALSPDHRVAFLLVHVFSMSLADVAEIEDVPVGTIKSRASRARQQLRERLPDSEDAHERV